MEFIWIENRDWIDMNSSLREESENSQILRFQGPTFNLSELLQGTRHKSNSPWCLCQQPLSASANVRRIAAEFWIASYAGDSTSCCAFKHNLSIPTGGTPLSWDPCEIKFLFSQGLPALTHGTCLSESCGAGLVMSASTKQSPPKLSWKSDF